MTTTRDEIRDAVIQYHNEKDAAPDPEVLVETIANIIEDDLRDFIDKSFH